MSNQTHRKLRVEILCDQFSRCRGSHRRWSARKAVLRKACSVIKKESLAQVFSCEFCKISKNTFSTEHLRTTAFQNEIMKKKKYLELQTFQQLCSMTSAYLGKMWVCFLELPFLKSWKCNENAVFLFKNTVKKLSFFLCLVVRSPLNEW